MLVPTALLRGGRAAGRRLFPAGWGLRWVMRLVRGEGGRWILASAEELEVGAVVAVDLGADGVWPAKVEAFVSDVHVRVRYVQWDSWADAGEPSAVVQRAKVLPLPAKGRDGRPAPRPTSSTCGSSPHLMVSLSLSLLCIANI